MARTPDPNQQSSPIPSLSNKGLRRRLASGFGAQSLTMLVIVGERVVLLPLYLYAWGLDTFEDYAVLAAAAGLIRLADFGTSSYYSASLRLSLAAGKLREFERHLATGLGIYLCIVVLGLAFSAGFFALPIVGILELSSLDETEASTIF